MNVIGSLWKTLSLKTIYLHWKPQWRNSFMRKLMLKENCSLKNEINLKNWELVFNLCFLPFSFFFLGPVSSDRDSGRSPDTHWNNILLQLSIWLLFISQQREIWKYMINKLKSLKVAKWRKDEWRWWRMNEEWWRMNKEWWRMNEEWWKMMISSCLGVLRMNEQTDEWTDINECM